MENNAFDPAELAHKLEQGTISPAERAWFEHWYRGFDDEELLLSNSVHTGTGRLKHAIFSRITLQMDADVKPIRKVITLWHGLATAAAMVLLFAFAAFYKNALFNLLYPAKQLVVTSKAGQHRQFALPDGTKVWLSPSSSIRYPAEFRGDQRLVQLNGEAFFEVLHDAARPFIINSGELKTVVLGTSFNVRAYPGAATASVTVISGKVGVVLSALGKKQQQIMTAHQNAVYNRAGGRLVKAEFPGADGFLNQRNGVFNFEGASMEAVVNELALQYGIKIQISPALAGKGFYGHLKTTEPVKRTLDKLCAVMDASYYLESGTYYLKELPSKIK